MLAYIKRKKIKMIKIENPKMYNRNMKYNIYIYIYNQNNQK